MVRETGSNRLLSVAGPPAGPRVSRWDQYLSMAFANSLKGWPARHRSMPAISDGKLYHLGFHGRVARSFGRRQRLAWLAHLRRLRTGSDPARATALCSGSDRRWSRVLYALDSTTIDLCVSRFPWVKFRKHKAAVYQRNTRTSVLSLNLPGHLRMPACLSIRRGVPKRQRPSHLPPHATFDLAIGKQLAEHWSARVNAVNIATRDIYWIPVTPLAAHITSTRAKSTASYVTVFHL
jgi:hypothetical protein